jgi:UDP-N-acetyl-2-amino-2-deoxyglucuronate dehydrogenase
MLECWHFGVKGVILPRMSQPRFALIGAAGFVAPRHMQAIKDVGGKLVAALDPHDAVGVLDRFDRETEFFTEPERFERHLEKLRREGNGVDWLSVCSPNYLHDTHIRMGLRVGARVICEKPLVLDPKNLDALAYDEQAANQAANIGVDNRQVFTVLQLRHAKLLQGLRDEATHVRLHYITPRGRWFARSWKGDSEKSGGLLTNIGIHMLDFLLWKFGAERKTHVDTRLPDLVAGTSSFERAATVDWTLSTGETASGRSERWIEMYGQRVEFAGFESLHSAVYRETLAGRGHGLEDARPAVELAARLR